MANQFVNSISPSDTKNSDNNNDSSTDSTLKILNDLIRIPSITPYDKGAQDYLIKHLKALGFRIKSLPSGPVSNFWAHRGETGPMFAFAGHTDVVDTGPIKDWKHPPFEPTIEDGYLYGRGTQDMKSGIACMIAAMETFIAENPNHPSQLGLLITSGEEGDDYMHGTPVIMDYLRSQNINLDYCVVGEPSSSQATGDMIRIGRRGSLHARLTVKGKQGHVAYPEAACNPVHHLSEFISTLTETKWCNGTEHFPATSLQISNIHAGQGAKNIIPGEVVLDFNFRYSPATSDEKIKLKVNQILKECFDSPVSYQVDWVLSGKPFYTPGGKLIESTSKVIERITGKKPILSTGGGTSDGRFIASPEIELIELGPVNDTIHQVNERCKLKDIQQLTNIYQHLLADLLQS